MQKNKYLLIKTFGCRLNQADEAFIYARLAKLGYIPYKSKSKDPENINLCIVNSCTVTATAARKSRNAAKQLKKLFPSALIIATGCDTEINPHIWKQESLADIIIPGSLKNQIDEILLNGNSLSQHHLSDDTFSENISPIFPFKNRPLVKIQEGCDCFCSFCIVPFARGKPRSRSKTEILNDVQKLLELGNKEIVLTGVNICKYNYNGTTLSKLIEEILKINQDFRLRISSTELDTQLYEIIRLVKDSSKICRFLHVPLQHGTDQILQKMNRKYSTTDFANFANFALNEIQDLHLGTDLICGLPGETDKLFEESCNFISQIPFANIHIFRFSPRQGTIAAKMPHPDGKIVKQRAKYLESIKSKLKKNFLASQIGKPASFIPEKFHQKVLAEGWSDNYIKTFVKNVLKNELTYVKFSAFKDSNSLLAEKIQQAQP